MPCKVLKANLFAGVALAVFTPVYSSAQEADSDASQARSGFDVITVTAQRREESLQDASVSIDVLGSDDLQKGGVYQIEDLQRIEPTVQVGMGGSAVQVYIRGSGDFVTTSYHDSAVSLNYDGVAAGRTQYVNGMFFDLERVEILKGPQGTLYGRNAIGGAVNFIPVTPKLGEFSGYGAFGVQNYSGFTTEGAVNIPLGDNSALRASAQVVTRDGYISDGTNDDKHESLRLQYLVEPSEDVSLRLGGHYQHFGGRGTGMVVYNPEGTPFPTGQTGSQTPEDRWTSIEDTLNADLLFLQGLTAPVPLFYTVDTDTVQQDNQIWGVNAHLDWDLGFGTLTVIPAYQNVELDSVSVPTLSFDSTDIYNGTPSRSETTSVEVRLGGSNDLMTWVVGGFYFNEDNLTVNTLLLGNVAETLFVGDLNTEAKAVFGEVTFSVTEALRLIGGLRYNDESKTVIADRYALFGSVQCPVMSTGPGGSCPGFSIPGSLPPGFGDGTYSADRLNYRAGFEFDITPDNLFYATVSTGFKSGGQTNALLPPYRAEDMRAISIGSKNQFGDILQLNVELFHNRMTDHQENFSTLDATGNQVSARLNGGKAISKGASVDALFRPFANGVFNVGVEYNDSEYKEFVYDNFVTNNPPAPASTGCVTAAVPVPAEASARITGVFEVDCSGFPLTRTPKWSGSVGYTHTVDLANGAEIEFAPNVVFASSRYLEVSFHPNSLAESYQLYNVSLTYRAPDDRYSVQLFGRNLSNDPVYTGGQLNPFVPAYVGRNIGAPRTYGARLQVNY